MQKGGIGKGEKGAVGRSESGSLDVSRNISGGRCNEIRAPGTIPAVSPREHYARRGRAEIAKNCLAGASRENARRMRIRAAEKG